MFISTAKAAIVAATMMATQQVEDRNIDMDWAIESMNAKTDLMRAVPGQFGVDLAELVGNVGVSETLSSECNDIYGIDFERAFPELALPRDLELAVRRVRSRNAIITTRRYRGFAFSYTDCTRIIEVYEQRNDQLADMIDVMQSE